MSHLSNIFYVLSNALLIPVMLLLVVLVVRVVGQCGRVLQEFVSRHQQQQARANLVQTLQENRRPALPEDGRGSAFMEAVRQIAAAPRDLPQVSYAMSQAELQWQRSLDRLRGLVKLGPALGLMGTLIPLGPALVGLAVGDIQTMSNNLVIAFSTTVVGLFIGMVAGFLVTLKKHWYQADSALLNFAADRLSASAVLPPETPEERSTASRNHTPLQEPSHV